MRPPPTVSSAESRAGPLADPKAGRKRFSISSSDRIPPPPCPIKIRFVSRSGNGHTQSDGSMPAESDMSRGARCRRRGASGLQPAELVVGRAGALAGYHGGSQRSTRRAGRAEARALVGFEQTLQHLTGVAFRRLLDLQVTNP